MANCVRRPRLFAVFGIAAALTSFTMVAPAAFSMGSTKAMRKRITSPAPGSGTVLAPHHLGVPEDIEGVWLFGSACTREPRTELFRPEKPSSDRKTVHKYLCNKMYKVVRQATATDEQETLSDLDPQKAVVRRVNNAAEGWVKPALWNKPLFRAAAMVGSGALAGRFAPFAAMLHLSAYSIWLGTNFWTTFIAGITMFKSLPRQQFGKLQGKLFPKYFQLGTACTAAMLLTGLRMGLPAGPAAASLVCTLANMLYFEPTATGVMIERYKRENEGLKDPAIDKALRARFSKLHGMSSLANLLALIGLVAHGALLSARL